MPGEVPHACIELPVSDKKNFHQEYIGHLKGVETSEFTMVHTAGVYVAHLAYPGGVYDVSSFEDDLYRVTTVDQTRFMGGEGDG